MARALLGNLGDVRVGCTQPGWKVGKKCPQKNPQVVQVCMFYVLLVMFNIFFVVVHLAATAISMFALALLLCI
jgi:hypothetical protein